MSPEAQRIAIAEACGWQIYNIERTQVLWQCVDPQGACVACDEDPDTTKASFAHLLPDYLNDLNAMRSAEEHLKDKIDDGVYEERIEMEMGTRGRAAFSTAKQRASAMVKTLNLWKE